MRINTGGEAKVIINFNDYKIDKAQERDKGEILTLIALEALKDITQEINALLYYMKQIDVDAGKVESLTGKYYNINELYVLSSLLSGKGESLNNFSKMIDKIIAGLSETPEPNECNAIMRKIESEYIKQRKPIIEKYKEGLEEFLKQEKDHGL